MTGSSGGSSSGSGGGMAVSMLRKWRSMRVLVVSW